MTKLTEVMCQKVHCQCYKQTPQSDQCIVWPFKLVHLSLLHFSSFVCILHNNSNNYVVFFFLKQGHRAYAGHKKTITPNKRQMVTHFLNPSLPEQVFNRIILDLHKDSLGQPELRTSKAGRDVTKYPIPECMCNSTNTRT